MATSLLIYVLSIPRCVINSTNFTGKGRMVTD